MQRVEYFRQFDILLERHDNGDFRVTYGLEVIDNLDYEPAAKELGLCIFHALECQSKLD